MVVQFVVFERETLSKIGEVPHPLDFLLFLAQQIALQTRDALQTQDAVQTLAQEFALQTQDALHAHFHCPNLREIKSLVDKSDTRCDDQAIRQYILDERRDHNVDCGTSKFHPLPHNAPSKWHMALVPRFLHYPHYAEKKRFRAVKKHYQAAKNSISGGQCCGTFAPQFLFWIPQSILANNE
jgi:hypothetical protein